MELINYGSVCFGFLAGYLSWRVFSTKGSTFGIGQLASLIGVLLSSTVLAVFPARTLDFSVYSMGLFLGFFVSPVLASLQSGVSSFAHEFHLTYTADHGTFEQQLKYLDEQWAEVEQFITAKLEERGGSLRQGDLWPLPLSPSGQIAALKKYARSHPMHVNSTVFFTGLKRVNRRASRN